MDVDVFMKSYFRALGGYVARMGIAPDQFMVGMKRGITAMAANDSGHANAESFWPEFLACIDMPEGLTADALQAAIGDFYENEFGELGADVAEPAAARAIEALAAKGYSLVLATMPMFPRRAVEGGLALGQHRPCGVLAASPRSRTHRHQAQARLLCGKPAAAGVEGRDAHGRQQHQGGPGRMPAARASWSPIS